MLPFCPLHVVLSTSSSQPKKWLDKKIYVAATTTTAIHRDPDANTAPLKCDAPATRVAQRVQSATLFRNSPSLWRN